MKKKVTLLIGLILAIAALVHGVPERYLVSLSLGFSSGALLLAAWCFLFKDDIWP
jgi:hypothetical protein